MILYFADRKMNIVGQASTELPGGISILDDKKVEDVETGVATFETYVQYDDETRKNVEECTAVGNYILRSDEGENEFYTIIESESDTKNKEIYVYAEDAGLDLINQTVGAYAADQAYPIAFYINKFAYDSGFEIGINEASDLSRKLSWEGESTVTERLASVATQFDNCEISYSFEVKNLEVTRKFINIYKKRGKNDGVKLRLNKEIDRIQVKKSIANLATALEVTGGIPENEENPITLKGYTYDDGDFYVKDGLLCSRKAKEIWSRYVWNKEPNKIDGESGHIIRQYSYDTTSQSELCNRAITELKKLREIEVNYEVDIATLPNNVKIGDTVNVIDEAGEMYLQTRLLKLEKSVVNKSYKATLGEFLLKNSDINEKVADLAKKFAENSLDAKMALNIANSASSKADDAQTVANSALSDSNDALTKANEAITKSETATQSAQEATTKANEAKTAVESVQSSVESIQTTVDNANQTAQNAWTASQTAQEDATTAKEQASQALTNANEAKTSATTATEKAESALTSSSSAVETANTAKSAAEQASATASSAKADAEQAQKDIDEFGKSLETLTETMTAEYARKTELTEAQTTLQTQISKNAAGIASNASQITIIDETANNAKDLANSASTIASEAQTKAYQATANATAAQTAADEAKASASAAQTNADNAKKAADDAAAVASKAQTDLEQAQADLATVQGRVDATEQDIADAQAKVLAAQTAADKAKEDAKTASDAASAAQSTADMANTNASNAQSTADQAAADALNAQQLANTANGNATAAQTKANEAAKAAANAQSTADTAKTNAETAQTKANEAAQAAVDAQTAADAADAKAQQAATDLATAQQNLADVTSRVDATEEEVATAQAAVDRAQKAADAAKASAATAQSTADTAKANAATAQNKANEAKTAADSAQSAADAAQEAADKAQADADALAVRVTTAETNITQNAEAIELRATKTEVTKSVNDINTNLSNNYYNKTQADAAIKVASDNINLSVSKTYATITDNQKAQAAANKAQSTANTAVNNAKTAQDTADDAKAKAESAKTDLSALTTRVTAAESSISQNANQITATVTEVTTVKKNAVTSSVEQFYLSTSPTSLSGGSWSTTQPTWSEGKYIWRRTLVTKGDGSTSYSPSANGVCITGNTGAKGATGTQGPQGVKGDTGAAGKGIKSTSITYQAWPNGTSTPTGTWSSSPPATSASNPYLWTRTIITYTDNTTSTSYSVGSTPEGIVVGGRNLLLKTNQGTSYWGVDSAGGAYSKESVLWLGTNAVKIKCATKAPTTGLGMYASFGGLTGNFDKLKPGGTYTLSYDTDGACEFPFSSLMTGSAQYVILKSAARVKYEETFYGNHYEYRLVLSDSLTNNNQVVYFGVGSYMSDGTEVIVANLKLEEGNKATDWTPAPEDVEKGYKDYADDAVSDATVTITESYNSLIEETSRQITAMVNSVKETADSNATSISTMSNQLQLTTEMAQFVKTTTKQLQDVVDGKVSAEEIQEWARFDGATLELGASNQPFKAKLSTTELAFYQGNNKVAWISNNELHILTAIITQSIGCGNFTFIDEGDLGFSLL